jgi:hypothetical protein
MNGENTESADNGEVPTKRSGIKINYLLVVILE